MEYSNLHHIFSNQPAFLLGTPPATTSLEPPRFPGMRPVSLVAPGLEN